MILQFNNNLRYQQYQRNPSHSSQDTHSVSGSTNNQGPLVNSQIYPQQGQIFTPYVPMVLYPEHTYGSIPEYPPNVPNLYQQPLPIVSSQGPSPQAPATHHHPVHPHHPSQPTQHSLHQQRHSQSPQHFSQQHIAQYHHLQYQDHQGPGFQSTVSDASRVIYLPNVQVPPESQPTSQPISSAGPSSKSSISPSYTPFVITPQVQNQILPPFNMEHTQNYPRHASFNVLSEKRRNPSLMYSQPRINSEPIISSMAITNLVNARTSHYKPKSTKRNTNPRINKLSESIKRSDQIFEKRSLQEGERSNDKMFCDFQDSLKIKLPSEFDEKFEFKFREKNEYKLFDSFVNHTSKVLDYFFPGSISRKIISSLAFHDDTLMLKYAVFCIGCLKFEKEGSEKLETSFEYYDRCMKIIKFFLNRDGIEQNDGGLFWRCLLSSIILSIYEIYFTDGESAHLKIASAIFSVIGTQSDERGSILNKSSFMEMCFWALINCDQQMSVKLGDSMYSSIESHWAVLFPEYFSAYDEYPPSDKANESIYSEDIAKWWSNKFTIILGAIQDFKNECTVLTMEEYESNSSLKVWLELKSKLDEFESKLPIYMKPLIHRPSSGANTFPKTYFTDSSIASTCIRIKYFNLVLYELLLNKTNVDTPQVKEEISRYANSFAEKTTKDIVGILKSYENNITVLSGGAYVVKNIAHYLSGNDVMLDDVSNLIDKIEFLLIS